MRRLGFRDELANLAATLHHFTGYERKAQAIRIGRGLPRRVGEMLGTADIIAQMSDRCYLEKCRDRLYPEFVLGALGAPKKGRKLAEFTSGDDLVARTPAFYEGATRRLNDDLGQAYLYAERYFDGENPYLDGMRKNVSHAAQPAPVLRRCPPHTLLPHALAFQYLERAGVDLRHVLALRERRGVRVLVDHAPQVSRQGIPLLQIRVQREARPPVVGDAQVGLHLVELEEHDDLVRIGLAVDHLLLQHLVELVERERLRLSPDRLEKVDRHLLERRADRHGRVQVPWRL